MFSMVRGGVSIGLIAFIISYWRQIKSGRSLFADPLFRICRLCHKATFDDSIVCNCGGTLEPSEYYRREAQRDN